MSVLRSLVLALAILIAPPAFATQTPSWPTEILRQPSDWYGSPRALEITHAVVRHQSPEGGFPKNTDLSTPPGDTADPRSANTIDNHGTTAPIRFLARVTDATGHVEARAAVERGLDYLLAAQYSNGGWPQFYPVRDGYYAHVTFNDDAMIHVLDLLRDVAGGESPFGFVDATRRGRAAHAVDKGLDVILRTQVRQGGKLAGWCAQYDEHTLAPAAARRFEPPSISGSETVAIVRFLMEIEQPSPEVIAAVEGAVAWLQASAIPDTAIEPFTATDGARDLRLVPAPGHRLWARFRDLETNRPLFADRDAVIYDDLSDISRERRTGYAYVGTWPEALLSREYPAWKAAR